MIQVVPIQNFFMVFTLSKIKYLIVFGFPYLLPKGIEVRVKVINTPDYCYQ